MDFKHFPRSAAECGRLLLAHEATTGYKTLNLAPGTTLSRHYAPGGGFVVKDRDRAIVTFLGDGRMKVQTHGRPSLALAARINACLPAGYKVHRHWEGSAVSIGYDLLHRGEPIEHITSSTTFTPETAETIAA